MSDNTLASLSDLNQIICTADSYIRKEYLCHLQDAQIVPVSSDLQQIHVGKNLRMFKIHSMAYSSEDNIGDKISCITNALSGWNGKQVFLLDSDGAHLDLYLGIANDDINLLGVQFETFKGSFLGSFPGCNISVLNNSKNEELLRSIFDEPEIRISSVSALTAPKDQQKTDVYRIEQFVDSLRGTPFTMLLIADSAIKHEISRLRENLEGIYTELSPYRNYSLSLNNNQSDSFTESFNVTTSESISSGSTVTKNTTFGNSKTHSSTSQQEVQDRQSKNQLLGTGASIAMFLAGQAGNAMNPMDLLQGLFYGGSISNILNSAQTLLSGSAPSTETTAEGNSYSISMSDSDSVTHQEGLSTAKGLSSGTSSGVGKTMQMNYENKSVTNLMELIQQQIQRLQHIEEIGGFHCAAYFVTGDNASALTVSNMYRSLLNRGSHYGQNNAINLWSDSSSVHSLSEYLKRLNHPMFHFESVLNYPTFTAASLIASDEYPNYASLPQKTLRGFPVSSHAEFARDIYSNMQQDEHGVEIGNIFHMGKTEDTRVALSLNTLRGHLFTAGSTGMGKSNFCYGLIQQLLHENINFMVIEPAKGEYDQVFGGFDGVKTFGTTPGYKPLLKINPFAFPEQIHVAEHIDKILDIFNSCWPMYAAMPAVLKDAVETIYKNCGFNLVTGHRSQCSRFPNFKDLLDIMPSIINQSAFSGEVKGNYIGSLVTRIKSLTDGIFGCIFTDYEIDNKVLFDGKTLVDLSRVGSSETKSLIMGLLIMKLQEYRMSNSRMNMPLKHITILEEAHHLLKKGGSSNAEGVNLREMSLEMITNAIAEMRTYGEGFIIADQSPSLLDPSVIRNTNTKVIFKLQESADRQVIGNALSLSEVQVNELSRLDCGTAVVYQSNWDNPVLSKIHYFDSSHFRAYNPKEINHCVDPVSIDSQCLAVALLDRLPSREDSSASVEACLNILRSSEYIDGNRTAMLQLLSNYANGHRDNLKFSQLCRIIDTIVDSQQLMDYAGDPSMIDQWHERALAYLADIVSLSEQECREIIALCINIRISDSVETKKLYYRYYAFCRHS